MYELLKHKSEFKWTIKEESSFQEVKKALSSTVGIFRPDWPKEFKLEIDTSHEGIAAISFQKLGEERPIAFASRRLLTHEIKYSVSEKECLAIL